LIEAEKLNVRFGILLNAIGYQEATPEEIALETADALDTENEVSSAASVVKNTEPIIPPDRPNEVISVCRNSAAGRSTVNNGAYIGKTVIPKTNDTLTQDGNSVVPDISEAKGDISRKPFDYSKDFAEQVVLQEDSLRDQIDQYVATNVPVAKAFNSLLQRVQKLKFHGKHMTEEMYITKSKKLEKLDEMMMELIEDMGGFDCKS